MKLNYHSCYNDFFNDDIKDLLSRVEHSIGNNYTPSKELILRVLQLNLDNVKVIWLGQDPYFQEGVATGRSFEASNITSWFDKYRQVSLKNIVRGIYKAYNNEFLNYKDILNEIAYGRFNLIPPKEWFDSLEEQGVMFLNTYFTCEIDKANSHRKIWEEFSMKLFKYISNYNSNIIWFLWGSEAKSILEYINVKHYSSNHPMMCSSKKEEDFQFNKCFVETKEIINWLGKRK